jgi:hypothetical protein
VVSAVDVAKRPEQFGDVTRYSGPRNLDSELR